MPSNDLFYYLKLVQREAGLTESASFPASPTSQEQRVIDHINGTLRYLNQKYYLAFKYTEYTLTTTPGVSTYDLMQAPYSQSFWRVNRLARNGVIRLSDDYILEYMDYTQIDEFRPDFIARSKSVAYSGSGQNLLLHPKPNGEQYKIRYYGTHIGTDSTGTTNKTRLTASSDLTMLQDEYEDALKYMAVAKVRLRDGIDEKYLEYKRMAEDWEKTLYDMSQPGEDAQPQLMIRPFGSECDIMRRYFPFGTEYES